MSDHPDDSLQTEELEAQVAELLEEIDRQAEAVERRMRGGDEDDAARELEGILGDVGSAATPPARSVQSEPEPTADTPQDTAEPVESSLDADVDTLINEANALTEAEPEPEAEPAPLDHDIEELIDAAADSEPPVAGDASAEEPRVPDVEGELPEDSTPEPAEQAPAAAAPEESENLDEELASEAADAIEHELDGEIETVDLTDAAPAAAFGDDSDLPEPEPVPAIASVDAPASEPDAQAPVEAGAGGRPGAPQRVLLMLVGAAQILSRPLEGLSATHRDTLGWIALNVLFIGLCVWLVLLFR